MEGMRDDFQPVETGVEAAAVAVAVAVAGEDRDLRYRNMRADQKVE